MRSGVVAWWRLLGAPFLGSVFCLENHYPRFRGVPSGFFKGCPKALPRWIRAYAGLRPVWNFLPCDGGLARLRVVGSLFAGDRPCMRKCLSADEELLVYPLHQIERSRDG